MKGAAARPAARRQAGFTLLELMAAAAVFAVLALAARQAAQAAAQRAAAGRTAAGFEAVADAARAHHLNAGGWPADEAALDRFLPRPLAALRNGEGGPYEVPLPAAEPARLPARTELSSLAAARLAQHLAGPTARLPNGAAAPFVVEIAVGVPGADAAHRRFALRDCAADRDGPERCRLTGRTEFAAGAAVAFDPAADIDFGGAAVNGVGELTVSRPDGTASIRADNISVDALVTERITIGEL